MNQNWIHTNPRTMDFAAQLEMRSTRSLSVGSCVDFGKLDYSPILGGKDRQETKN